MLDARRRRSATQLVNLKRGIPSVIIAAEASYHQLYDHCTAKYLTQAGMKTEWLPLQKVGIHGNGHMVMIEKNNLAIAKVIDDWAKEEREVRPTRSGRVAGSRSLRRLATLARSVPVFLISGLPYTSPRQIAMNRMPHSE